MILFSLVTLYSVEQGPLSLEVLTHYKLHPSENLKGPMWHQFLCLILDLTSLEYSWIWHEEWPYVIVCQCLACDMSKCKRFERCPQINMRVARPVRVFAPCDWPAYGGRGERVWGGARSRTRRAVLAPNWAIGIPFSSFANKY